MRAAEVTLMGEQRTTLRSWVAAGKTEWRLAFRAQIILARADGLTNKEAAAGWRPAGDGQQVARPVCAARLGRGGRCPRSGKPRHYDAQDERRILGLWMRRRRPVMRVGTAPCLASIWAISPSTRSGGCCGSTRSRWSDGGAGASARSGVRTEGRGHCRALSAASGRTPWCCRWTRSPTSRPWSAPKAWLKLPNGKALTGFNHEYKRHGTTTLFAALDVVTGLVKAGHYRRRRRVEFLHFMNRVVVDHPAARFTSSWTT